MVTIERCISVAAQFSFRWLSEVETNTNTNTVSLETAYHSPTPHHLQSLSQNDTLNPLIAKKGAHSCLPHSSPASLVLSDPILP